MPHSEAVEEHQASLRAGANDIRVWSVVHGEQVSHFKLREFANPIGIAIVHRLLPRQLEYLRQDLCDMFSVEIGIVITNSTRLPEDTARLVAEYGWIDDGGRVSRNSTHEALIWGGIAADAFAQKKGTSGRAGRIPVHMVGRVAKKHFDKVIVYAGNENPLRDHVHMDLRRGGVKI